MMCAPKEGAGTLWLDNSGPGLTGPAAERPILMLRNKIQGLEATDPDFPQLSLAERRKKLRVRTYIRLEFDSAQGRCSGIVTDLSLDGLRMRCQSPLQVGELVEVFFPDSSDRASTGSVRCRTVWTQELRQVGRISYEAGLAFEDSRENMQRSWVRYVLEQLGFDENKTFQRRRFLRARGQVPARAFTHQQEESFNGEIVNLGVGGGLLALDQPLSKDRVIDCEFCLWRILPPLRLPCRIMNVVPDPEHEGEGPPRHLHSLLFLGMDTHEVKLLGNYVIFMINQSED
jgi:hypothetical protein